MFTRASRSCAGGWNGTYRVLNPVGSSSLLTPTFPNSCVDSRPPFDSPIDLHFVILSSPPVPCRCVPLLRSCSVSVGGFFRDSPVGGVAPASTSALVLLPLHD